MLIVCAAVFVLSMFGYVKMNVGVFTTLGLLIILCLAISMSIPWVRRLQDNRLKILSFVFLGVISVCAIFWIISLFMGVGLFKALSKKDSSYTVEKLIFLLNFIKVTLIITVQVVVASTVAGNITKFGKERIPLQVMYYLGLIVIDIILTSLFSIIKIKSATEIGFSETSVNILTSKFMWALFFVSVVIIGIANGFGKAQARRNQQALHEKEIFGENNDLKLERLEENAFEQNKDESVEEKLATLNKLYQNNLISQEEYEAKRAEILKNL